MTLHYNTYIHTIPYRTVPYQFLLGKLAISMSPFSIAMYKLPEGITHFAAFKKGFFHVDSPIKRPLFLSPRLIFLSMPRSCFNWATAFWATTSTSQWKISFYVTYLILHFNSIVNILHVCICICIFIRICICLCTCIRICICMCICICICMCICICICMCICIYIHIHTCTYIEIHRHT